MKLVRKLFLGIFLLLLLCYGLVWALSPWLVRSLTADSLAMQNVVLGPDSRVRLNLFSSRLSVDTLSLRQNDQTTYQLEELVLHYSVWRLLSKQVYIERLHLRGMSLHVVKQGEQLTIAGMGVSRLSAGDQSAEFEGGGASADPNPNTEPSFVEAFSFLAPEISLEDIRVKLTHEGRDHSVLINQLELKDSAYRNHVLDAKIALNASIDGAAIEIKADVNVQPDASELSLALDIKAFNPEVYRYLLPEGFSKLEAAVDVALKTNLRLKGEQLSINTASLEFALAELEVHEKTFRIGLKNLDVSVPDFSAQLQLGGTAIQAQAQIEMEMASLFVGLAESPVILTTLEHLKTGELRVNASDAHYQLSAAKLALEGLVLSKVNEALPALLTMQAIAFDSLELTPELVSIEHINLSAGQAHIMMDKEGTLQTLVDTAALSGAPVETQSAVAAEEAPSQSDPSALSETAPRILLRQLTLSEPLNIAIRDQSNSNVFKKTFVLTDVAVGEVDSAAPKNHTNFKLKLADKAYFKGELAGWVTPFTEKLNLDAQLKMREFSLHEVAPYLKDSLGFEVKAGQLDLDTDANINEDVLASTSTIFMRGTEFGASQKGDEANLIGQTAIPLNVALGMLKDGDGNIELKVPANGNINDPSFGVHHIVGLVIKKVAMSQAKKQLMNMFVPYAQVVSVALSAGSYALKVRFEDLPYAPGQIEVGEAQAQFISQITALLKDKQDVQVRVCPVAVMSDLLDPQTAPISAEQREQLLSIAERRAQAFKTALVVDGNIASARLLLCSPVVDSKNNATPRLEFGT